MALQATDLQLSYTWRVWTCHKLIRHISIQSRTTIWLFLFRCWRTSLHFHHRKKTQVFLGFMPPIFRFKRCHRTHRTYYCTSMLQKLRLFKENRKDALDWLKQNLSWWLASLCNSNEILRHNKRWILNATYRVAFWICKHEMCSLVSLWQKRRINIWLL